MMPLARAAFRKICETLLAMMPQDGPIPQLLYNASNNLARGLYRAGQGDAEGVKRAFFATVTASWGTLRNSS